MSQRNDLGDDVLIARIAARDERAIELLYDRYARAVYGISLRMLGRAEHAEEVVQETFWRVWRRAESYQAGRGSPATWLFGIAHNLCIDELRKLRVRPQEQCDDFSEEPAYLAAPDPAADVPMVAMDRERHRIISHVLAAIAPEQREVIELAYFSGLSQSEIAERLASPLGTIKSRIRTGLRRLREVLYERRIQVDDLIP